MPFALPPLLPRRGLGAPHRPALRWALAAMVAALLAVAPWAYCDLVGSRDVCAERDGAENTWVAATVRNAGAMLTQVVETATDLITR